MCDRVYFIIYIYYSFMLHNYAQNQGMHTMTYLFKPKLNLYDTRNYPFYVGVIVFLILDCENKRQTKH